MDGDYFDNPKPGKLLKALAAIGANKDDIVLDFFLWLRNNCPCINAIKL